MDNRLGDDQSRQFELQLIGNMFANQYNNYQQNNQLQFQPVQFELAPNLFIDLPTSIQSHSMQTQSIPITKDTTQQLFQFNVPSSNGVQQFRDFQNSFLNLSNSSILSNDPQSYNYRFLNPLSFLPAIPQFTLQQNTNININSNTNKYQNTANNTLLSISSNSNNNNKEHKINKTNNDIVKKERGKVTQIDNVNNHIRDERAKYFRCSGCCKKFKDKKHLKEHIDNINVKKPYKCTKCCKSFTRLGNLNNHNKAHPLDNFNNTQILDLNNNNNNNIPPFIGTAKLFKCNECTKSFRNKAGLTNHQIVHNGIKPHKCPFKSCNKSFGRSCDLNRHIRLHTGCKPFKCTHSNCSKSFTRSVQLRLHVMDHTGHRPFKCDLCNKGFKTLQNAQIHMRIHTGEKPFKCNLCSKRFTQSPSLKTHIRSIHQ